MAAATPGDVHVGALSHIALAHHRHLYLVSTRSSLIRMEQVSHFVLHIAAFSDISYICHCSKTDLRKWRTKTMAHHLYPLNVLENVRGHKQMLQQMHHLGQSD